MAEERVLKKAPIASRGLAFFTDYFIYFFISIIIIFGIDDFRKDIGLLFPFHLDYLSTPPIIAICIVFNDIISGRSIGKRWLKLAVRDHNDLTKIPNLGRLILRNIFLIIWPVEYLWMLTNPENRRLGDIVAGTDVFCLDGN